MYESESLYLETSPEACQMWREAWVCDEDFSHWCCINLIVRLS